MVPISRKQDETIILDHDIVITVLSVDRPRVRLGIEAPRCCSIYRGELYDLVPRPARRPADIPLSARKLIVDALKVKLQSGVAEGILTTEGLALIEKALSEVLADQQTTPENA